MKTEQELLMALDQPETNPPTAVAALSAEELKERAAAIRRGKEELRDLGEPTKERPQRIQASRKQVLQLVTKYRKELQKQSAAQLQKGAKRKFRTVEEYVKVLILRAAPETNPKKLEKPVGELFPLLKRFDWRGLQVVPNVRQQTSGTCWAEASTGAFESSLRIQRANFSTGTEGERGFSVDVIMLDVKSTLDRVPPFREPTGGRHETVFNHYFKEGIPLDEIRVKPGGAQTSFIEVIGPEGQVVTPPPPPPPDPLPKESIKAIAWDYVNDNEDFASLPSVEQIKRALLEHGPLAVMVGHNNDFKKYGRPREAKDTKVAGGVSLRFRKPFFNFAKQEGRGPLQASFPPEVFVPTEFLSQQGPLEQDVVLQFQANSAPTLEANSAAPLRPTDADDAVLFVNLGSSVELFFAPNNGVVVEEDSATKETILRFPANTNAQFTKLESGELEMRFPIDPAPVFDLNTSQAPNHLVLLIGWDDNKGTKGAWVIQNSQGTDWGYQCNGPVVRGWTADGAEDRGYMYIGYGCNQIGAAAAWVEAPLIKQAWIDKMPG